MKTNGLILQVALPTPLRKTFDYLPLPEIEKTKWQIGQRVQVSFGSRHLIGVITGFTEKSDVPDNKLKSVIALIDDQPLISETLLGLYQWASDYYHHPIGEVIVGTLPKKIRDGNNNDAPTPTLACTLEKPTFELTLEQKNAIEKITRANGFESFLLHGITGSGKTEVYLQVIEKIIEKKQQALVLVPEIALTPQTVSRFEKRFSAPVLLLHSGLTDLKRYQAWMQATKNLPCIVIGTRSAVFAPLNNLGVIVIDEEHDGSFKQHSGFRYSARDVAMMRAKLLDIPIILGSATPSIETWHNANQKKYHLLNLTRRAGDAVLPNIILHNVRDEKLVNGLSPVVIQAIEKKLNQKQQVLLFLNRRGYAPILLCHHCGFSVNCKHCDARMTLHESPKRLVCHHCGDTISVPRVCPDCQQSELISLGLGTEQLEETIRALFPDKKIARVDRDTITTFKKLETVLSQIQKGEVDIIIGTQMLIKGHHFDQLMLVVALDVDHALFSSDFRAVEKLGQSLIQVAGRAGRVLDKGEVLIQTHYPNHPLLKKLLQEDYVAFSQAILSERIQMQLPPFHHMALLRAEGKNKKAVNDLLSRVKIKVGREKNASDIIGPLPTIMEKKAGVYRAQLIVQSSQRAQLRKSLQQLLRELESEKKSAIRWMVDVDPVEM